MMVSLFFVITGSTGSGKSSLLSELQRRGYRCFEEAARIVIREELAAGGDALPWANIALFKKKIFIKAKDAYLEANKNPDTLTFFDRDLLDLIAYDRLTGTSSPPEFVDAVQKFPYNNNVFILPPWKEIYCTDSERRQNFEEAKKSYLNLVNVYREFGRNLIEVPKISIEKRADFVIAKVSELRCLPQ